MRIGFIGLGNVGAKLAGSILRNGHSLTVHDIDPQAMAPFQERGAQIATTPAELTRRVDMIITCLPSPQISAAVMEGEDGVLSVISGGQIWAEMSTTDEAEVRRLGKQVEAGGGEAMDCPVSGGCHRAATGNIAIFVGARRKIFVQTLPILSVMGRQILHTGELGTASILKVVTNYLASVHLTAIGEALMVAKKSGLDLNIAYEAIRISSGNSFVHETESQVILNGSRNINFTMDLVVKDMGIFDAQAKRCGVPVEISPLVLEIFRDGLKRYGARAWSPGIVRRLEEACGEELLASGFPPEITDQEKETIGHEVICQRS